VQPRARAASWRSFVSWGTVVTGALAAVVWGLGWSWTAGVAIVLLLYVHEVGHVLAALWRRVPIRRAPIFLPGLGAVVLVDPTSKVWDEVIVALGGPVVGGAVALAARAAGTRWNLPALVFAGDLGVILNIANLLPFKPLDGGRIVARTGWLGFVPAALLGLGLLALNLALKTGLLLSAIIVGGLVWGFRSVRREQGVGLGTRLGIIAVYLLAGLALSAGYLATMLLPFAGLQRPAASSPTSIAVAPPGVFRGPAGLAVDGAGNVYVADSGDDRIQELSPSGQPIAQWGASGVDPGQFDGPSGVALDRAGNLYVADAGNSRIQVFSPRGELLATWGQEGEGPGEFEYPVGVAVDGQGHVYVADAGNYRVQKLSPAGEPLASWGTYEHGTGEFLDITAVAVDERGDVYVADAGNNRITKFGPDGAVLDRFDGDGGGRFQRPYGVAVDRQGNIYLADWGNRRVAKLSPAGEPLGGWAAPPAGQGQATGPQAIAVDAQGNVYVAGWGRNRIGKLSPAGEQLAQWGADDRPADPPRSPGATVGGLTGAGGRLPGGARLEWVAAAFLAVWLLDAAAWRFALKPERGAAGRYATLALAGWPRILLFDPWWFPFTACLAAHLAGLPGLRWLEALVRRLSARRNLAAGVGCALGYDCLQRQGRGAEGWLERLTPHLRAAGPDTVDRTFGCLLLLGHRRRGYAWLVESLADARPEALSWQPANNLAYSLAFAGRPADALPFARAALAQKPDSSHANGTLGEVLLGLGDPSEAETHLRESLRLQEQPVNRLALARALAAQGRHAEAIDEAERGLRGHTGPWLEDEPGPDAVAAWLAEWRAAIASANPAASPRDQLVPTA
jgi:DNA-binding beta-propeller fold protein YncE/tetratricopeptide (TPR) repeat protein